MSYSNYLKFKKWDKIISKIKYLDQIIYVILEYFGESLMVFKYLYKFIISLILFVLLIILIPFLSIWMILLNLLKKILYFYGLRLFSKNAKEKKGQIIINEKDKTKQWLRIREKLYKQYNNNKNKYIRKSNEKINVDEETKNKFDELKKV